MSFATTLPWPNSKLLLGAFDDVLPYIDPALNGPDGDVFSPAARLRSTAVKKAADDTSDAGETAVAVQAEHPTVGPISEEIAADAILAPLSQAAIAPRISAPIRAEYVQRGAHVRKGQLLLTLEDRDLQGAALDSRGSLTLRAGCLRNGYTSHHSRRRTEGPAGCRSGKGQPRSGQPHGGRTQTAAEPRRHRRTGYRYGNRRGSAGTSRL